MKFNQILLGTVAMAACLAVPLLSQAQTIPVPASSINGARGVIGFTIPALPSDLCTSSNNNCITNASLPNAVWDQVGGTITQLQQNQGGKPWTTYFLGQTVCVGGNYACMTIQWDGIPVFVTPPFTGMGPGRLPNVNEVLGTNYDCQGVIGAGTATNWAAFPTGLTVTNNIPTGWMTSISSVVCNPSGGGGNAN